MLFVPDIRCAVMLGRTALPDLSNILFYYNIHFISIVHLCHKPIKAMPIRPNTPRTAHSRYTHPAGIKLSKLLCELNGKNGCISACIMLSSNICENVPKNAPVETANQEIFELTCSHLRYLKFSKAFHALSVHWQTTLPAKRANKPIINAPG